MKKREAKNRGKIFIDLVKQVLQDPAYREKEPLRNAAKAAAEPVVADLKRHGITVDELGGLRAGHPKIKAAIPILVKWLPVVEHPWVRMTIVRRLSIPAARGVAAPILLEEFKKLKAPADSLKWAVGNALSITATDRDLDDLLNIAEAKNHGRAREMIVLGLSRFDTEKTRTVLLKLLSDDDVKAHAAAALGSLGAQEAVPKLTRMLADKDYLARKEAKTALKDIHKRGSHFSKRRK